MASVLVTGSSRGIGMATVLALGRAGHSVYATMRDPGRSPELAQLAEKESLPIKVSVMDVDSDNSVKESIGAIQKENGPIDVLVNNAGIERIGSVEELNISQFRAVMETNYFGSLRCIKASAILISNIPAAFPILLSESKTISERHIVVGRCQRI